MMNKRIWMLCAACVVGAAYARDSFNPDTDILIAQFDGRTDADDIHAQAALGCLLAHADFAEVNVYGVMGATGRQIGDIIDSTELLTAIYTPW